MQYVKLFNVVFIYFIVLCMAWLVKIDGHAPQQIHNHTLTYKCDIALILDDSLSIKRQHGGAANFDLMIGVVNKFPDYFLMGENHIRVAIIVFSDASRLLLNLTADENLVRKFSTKATWGSTATDWALEDAKAKVFANARPKAMRIVILITDGDANDWEAAEDASKALREEGTLIFVAFIGMDYQTRPEVKRHIDKVAGNPSNVFPIEAFYNLTTAVYEKIIHGIKCEYTEGCRLDKSQTCVAEYWQPMIADANCTNIPPTKPPSKKCELIDCEEICNGWPWKEQDRECQEEDAGKNLTVNRGPKPVGKDRMLEHCPKEKLVKTCPPKTTESSTTGESPKTTEPPATTTPSGTESKTTESLTKAPPATKKAAVVETESPSSMATEWWIILLMVIVGLLILTVIVVGIISGSRKRKKKALMAKKKAAMEIPASSDPPSTIEGDRKRRPPGQSESTSAIDQSVGSQDGKGRPRNRMAQFSYEKSPAADHSVQASLAMDEKVRSPKKQRVKSTSGRTDNVKSISPVVKKSVDTKPAVVKRK